MPGRIVPEDDTSALEAREIHDHVRTLSGAQWDLADDDRFGEKPAVASDLRKVEVVLLEVEVPFPVIGAVEDAETVFSGLDFEIRSDRAVHHGCISLQVGHPNRVMAVACCRVIERAILVE